MFFMRYMLVVSFSTVFFSKAERRILDGKDVTVQRGFVVYFIKSSADEVPYDAWLCAGAIVSEWYILTSAACVKDVQHLYVIAGYDTYVKYEDLESDECTRTMKIKVTDMCVAKAYQFDYPKVELWANIDIALVRLENAIDFEDSRWTEHCSYAPQAIEVNYDEHLQQPMTDALVLGWGHVDRWRSVEDTEDHNERTLKYGVVQLADPEECKRQFQAPLRPIIEKYMICSIDEGSVDENGELLHEPAGPFRERCGDGALRMGNKCVRDPYYSKNAGPTRSRTRYVPGSRPRPRPRPRPSPKSSAKARSPLFYRYTRRRGICQNDHGGPIIAWRGPKEVLIGVSSVFRVNKENHACEPPFLYSSTYCSGSFIHCVLNEGFFEDRDNPAAEEDGTRRCDQVAREGGMTIVRRHISWADHPDGPAYNEKARNGRHMNRGAEISSNNSSLRMRPQVPINGFTRP